MMHDEVTTTFKVGQSTTVTTHTTPQDNNRNATPLNKSKLQIEHNYRHTDKELDTEDDKESDAAATTILKGQRKAENANNQPRMHFHNNPYNTV
jgi:hypothetical protein